MRLLSSMACATALAACASNTTTNGDGNTPPTTSRQFTLRIENLASWQFSKLSAQRQKTTLSEGDLAPGESYQIRFSAAPGHRLSFVAMMMESNDWFFAPDPAGIALYENGVPISGDITSRIQLWDAGSELDEEPGVGPNTGMLQVQSTDGDPDADATVRQVAPIAKLGSGAMFQRPTVAQMLKVTIKLESDGYWTLDFTNVATATTLQTTAGPRPVHISSVVWALHREGTAFFDAGMPLRPNALERLVESGDPYSMIDALRFDIGVATPLSRGLAVVHPSGTPLFTIGTADVGAGMKALAEDGDPTQLAASLAADGTVLTLDHAGGAARHGEAFETTFTASPGDRLSFATGFVAANDWYFAPAQDGLALFSGSDARWGDVTSEIRLCDLGTESDQELDVGDAVGTQQSAPGTGTADGRAEVRVVERSVYDVPVAYHLRVTLAPAAAAP
jgi:hypothetical protein